MSILVLRMQKQQNRLKKSVLKLKGVLIISTIYRIVTIKLYHPKLQMNGRMKTFGFVWFTKYTKEAGKLKHT